MIGESLIAAASSLSWFVIFSAQAVIRTGRGSHLPGLFLRAFALSGHSAHSKSARRGVAGSAILAALGQTPVLALATYDSDRLSLGAWAILVIEVVAALAWLWLLRQWVARHQAS